MGLSIGWVVLLLMAWLTPSAQTSPGDWRRADEATLRLKPDAFPNVPPELRTALENRGCRVPQPYNAAGQKNNVITGRFTSAGQTDWAVLCSREKRSTILVFRGGRPDQDGYHRRRTRFAVSPGRLRRAGNRVFAVARGRHAGNDPPPLAQREIADSRA